MLRIDEDDNSHCVYKKCCKQTFIFTKRVYFAISLSFANIVTMVLELKKYSINIMIRDVWKLKDKKKKCLLLMNN